MRILFVSNYYPPYFVGGYELGCRDVVENLRARGHDVHVLTSIHGLIKGEEYPPENGVDRILRLGAPHDPTSPGKPDTKQECRKFSAVVKKFSPDIVYFWNQTGLCLWFPACAKLLGKKCAFFISDTSFTAWRIAAVLLVRMVMYPRSRLQRLIKRLLTQAFGGTWLMKGYPVLFHQPCHFCSGFLRNYAYKNYIDVSDSLSDVIHWGIDPGRFHPDPSSPASWPPRKLLYIGQIIGHKGTITAIEALAILVKKPGFEDMTLSIVGGGVDPEYEKQLHALPQKLGIERNVHFTGLIQRENLPDIYRAHNVLIFPSIWEEPFAITPLEAIASKLPVVGTVTGGSGEIFRDKETAMVFEAGNAKSCADAVLLLCSDRELFDTIRKQAYALVTTRHTIAAMTDRIEAGLIRIAKTDDPA